MGQKKSVFNPQEIPPRVFFNWISLTGFFIALFGFTSSLFFFLLEFGEKTTGYQSIPLFFFLLLTLPGVLIFFAGMLREKRRRSQGIAPSIPNTFIKKNPLISLLGTAVMVTIFTIIIASGTFNLYEVTKSNSFCGQTCHEVMNPEWVAYRYSSHARIKCVECHIGSGVNWYIKSKLSGARQLYAVTLGEPSRPIPTPIHNLRPARDTCEECHWPEKFIGYKETVRSFFLADEGNTRYTLRMLMKIGGERSGLLTGTGIHYHMLITPEVKYISRDNKRQDIAWVSFKKPDGKVIEFNDVNNPLSDEEKLQLEVRSMDCLDCHNRPVHKFKSPMVAVNEAMAAGLISIELPYIKFQAVRALDGKYHDIKEAMEQIDSKLHGFYAKNYPDLFQNEKEKLLQNIHEVQKIYRRNFFPNMKVNWSKYPDNIGHRDWPGCFRCHNDRLESSEGETIFTTCNKCHLILAQGADVNKINVDLKQGLNFVHPAGNEVMEEYIQCSDCHTGGIETYQ